ncbi:hypothetical protein TNCT_8371 [Trichonephila clavata]|uniref:Uncharacterized protein n=1 Tax=Trichonephila clavata TaxID=2740835 RepID=A0A8X6HMJ9_TRICU|nr:hypothetical protein TNCT_8371 [Trichonephila clavata]
MGTHTTYRQPCLLEAVEPSQSVILVGKQLEQNNCAKRIFLTLPKPQRQTVTLLFTTQDLSTVTERMQKCNADRQEVFSDYFRGQALNHRWTNLNIFKQNLSASWNLGHPAQTGHTDDLESLRRGIDRTHQVDPE